MKFNLNHHVVPAILALFVLGSVASVHAATNTGNMTVSANVETACTVSASPMAFGTVVPGATKETTATVTANCTTGTPYTLDLGDGLNHTVDGGPAGGLYRRQMAATTFLLPYVIYIDATRATEIGATAVALNNLLTTTVGNGANQDVMIYGRIKAAETTVQEPGAYVDTVVVTIGF
ncbi:MAG: spore coat protein U domain-containing protein [Desulfobulbaceae bacterium]|nr:spore coat protein U domain-containing protein [Desulfobulbaceae bacterium]